MFQQHISGWGLFEVEWKESPRSKKASIYQRWAPDAETAGSSLASVLARDDGMHEVVIVNVTTLQEPTATVAA